MKCRAKLLLLSRAGLDIESHSAAGGGYFKVERGLLTAAASSKPSFLKDLGMKMAGNDDEGLLTFLKANTPLNNTEGLCLGTNRLSRSIRHLPLFGCDGRRPPGAGRHTNVSSLTFQVALEQDAEAQTALIGQDGLCSSAIICQPVDRLEAVVV
ncbi:unnamed protein product [Pleuronectes platessa]|uniref:Uncharacterized protein n=1 Tax=Pleuronectes platessa TaxID=8262 RepID=A0A9N7ULJ1_PLEPL|nr:unnamed protein product [Pleuronectes platessa]